MVGVSLLRFHHIFFLVLFDLYFLFRERSPYLYSPNSRLLFPGPPKRALIKDESVKKKLSVYLSPVI